LVAIVSIATKYGILQHILCVALGGKSSSGRSIHERIGRVHPSDGRRLKINKIDDQPRKRYADHRWVDREEEEDHGYV
jgi:hypothetical protein